MENMGQGSLSQPQPPATAPWPVPLSRPGHPGAGALLHSSAIKDGIFSEHKSHILVARLRVSRRGQLRGWEEGGCAAACRRQQEGGSTAGLPCLPGSGKQIRQQSGHHALFNLWSIKSKLMAKLSKLPAARPQARSQVGVAHMARLSAQREEGESHHAKRRLCTTTAATAAAPTWRA